MILKPKKQPKEVACDELAGYLDEICTEEPLNLLRSASMIGKTMFLALDLGLNKREAHAVLRKHFRKHQVHHQFWWTEKIAYDSWVLALQRKQGAAS